MLAALVASTVIATTAPSFHQPARVGERLMATPAPRVEVAGVEWRTRAITNTPGPRATPTAAERYGAAGAEDAVVYVRVGTQVVAIDPWTRIPEEGLSGLEAGRNQWLRERGYTGGVRTFTNDSAVSAPAPATPAAPTPNAIKPETGPGAAAPILPIQPRATIRVPEGAKRDRPKFRVEGPTPEPTVG